jgi:hypothetical protein
MRRWELWMTLEVQGAHCVVQPSEREGYAMFLIVLVILALAILGVLGAMLFSAWY